MTPNAAGTVNSRSFRRSAWERLVDALRCGDAGSSSSNRLHRCDAERPQVRPQAEHRNEGSHRVRINDPGRFI
jgi:hypothetical protein